MKVLHLNAADIEGGAARAATRLVRGLAELGVDAGLRVQRRNGLSPLVAGPSSPLAKALGRARPTVEQLLSGISPSRLNGPFSAACLPERLTAQIAQAAPHIVHLHWVARMMRLESLRHFRVPLVWTMHDSWAFTGGCYLPGACTRYRERCGSCPVLASDREQDLSRRIWLRKKKAWADLNLTVVAPSRWMAERVRSSSLFHDLRIEVIPNGLETDLFRPADKHGAREALSLPPGKKLILFGAKGATSDRNKGFHLLAEALRELTATGRLRDTAELAVFGLGEADRLPELAFPAHRLGWQGDDTTLALLYAAADVFVLPSLQENLPYTVMEAMACGTPCVAFNQGGVPDLVDHRENGYLAEPYRTADLARGIAWILEGDDNHDRLAAGAREKVTGEFSLKRVAQRHLALYRTLCG